MVILQRSPTVRKTSINPECLGVVPSALEQKFIEQGLPENHAPCAEHNPGGWQWSLSKTYCHRLISTRALQKTQCTVLMNSQTCRRDNGPCQEHARTKGYFTDFIENTSLHNPDTPTHVNRSREKKNTRDRLLGRHGLAHVGRPLRLHMWLVGIGLTDSP